MNVPLTKDERMSDNVVYANNSLNGDSSKSSVIESGKSSVIESSSSTSSVIESTKGSRVESIKSSVIEVLTLSMYNSKRQDSVVSSTTDVTRINDVILWDLIYEDREIMIFFKIIGFHWYH